MSISKYKVLVKVLEQGSLTKAAEILGYTQSGISHTINSLEEEFGFELIVRSRTGTKLTKNGEEVITTIREILKWNEYLEQQIAAVHGIKLVEGDYHEIEEWVLNGEIDCGFLSLPTRNKFDVTPLHKDTLFMLLPFGHRLASRETIDLNEIAEEPFIMPYQGHDDDMKRNFKKASFQPNIKYTAIDDYAIMAMVEKGLGISILPELVLKGQQWKIHQKVLTESNFRHLGIAVKSK